MAPGLYFISGEGILFIDNGGFKTYNSKKEEIDMLQNEKLRIDVKNAKRIFKTYWVTFVAAIAAFLISLTLLILKLKGL